MRFHSAQAFSSTSGVLGDASIRERNLLGRGQDLSLSLQVGERQQQVDLSFTEPYFLGKNLAAGFDVFSTSSDLQTESSFDRDSLGFALRSGYRITEPLSQTWRYTLREDKITDIASDASLAIQEQEGAFITSSIGQALLYDKRDSRFDPTKGYFVKLENILAGLGGDSQYLKNEVSGAKYYQVHDKWIVNLGASTGYIVGLGEDIRIIDRFFLGGKNLRGFEDSGVGPRDTATSDAIGGNWFYRGTLGLTFPLGLPNEFGLRGRLFADAGSIGENDTTIATIVDKSSLRMSVGTGILWDSPFGPVSIDLSEAILKEDFDETELLRFSFGARF